MYIYGGYTDIGKRNINQDAYWVGVNKANYLLGIVCDGIGSMSSSHVASSMIVSCFQKTFLKSSRISKPVVWFQKNLKKSFKQISDYTNRQLDGVKIGTTLVMILIKDNVAYIFNIGDSRCYKYDSSKVPTWNKITFDHNLENYLKTANATQEIVTQYEGSLLSLTNYIESNNWKHVNFDTFKVDLKPNDFLALCTDGVYNFFEINSLNFSELKAKKNNDLNDIALKVVMKSIENNSTDNLTLVLIGVM